MRTFIIILFIFLPILSISQNRAVYDSIPDGKNSYGSYITKIGDVIKVGDTLQIGLPSNPSGFNYITQLGQRAGSFLADRKIIIFKIRTFKDKRFSNRAYLSFKGYGALVDIDYESALISGEIKK